MASNLPHDMRAADTISSRLIYMSALLDALRALGGSGRSGQVYALLVDGGVARSSDLKAQQASGETRFVKETRFARKELVDAGLILNGQSGVWVLSDLGWQTTLTPEEARKLVRDRRHLKSRAAMKFGSQGRASVPTTGPRPVSWTGQVTRDAAGAAWTYVMKFGDTDVWKIGHARDVEARLALINVHVPVEILEQQWLPFLRYAWPDSGCAYAMEQELFRMLKRRRTSGERVRCPESELLEAWRKVATQLSGFIPVRPPA
jgi:hypothetical protein